jgi:hypothetical protein
MTRPPRLLGRGGFFASAHNVARLRQYEFFSTKLLLQENKSVFLACDW